VTAAGSSNTTRVPNHVPGPADLTRRVQPNPTEDDRIRPSPSAYAPIIIRVSGVRVPPPASEKPRNCGLLRFWAFPRNVSSRGQAGRPWRCRPR
jgi:hypothetical protein